MTTEMMDRQAEDFIVCPCGNAPHLDGFYCSDPDGTIRDLGEGPDPEWDGDTMACFGCGRVFSLTTNVVSGRMTDAMLAGALAVALPLPDSPIARVRLDAARLRLREEQERCASPDDIAFWKSEVSRLEVVAGDEEITREARAMALGG